MRSIFGGVLLIASMVSSAGAANEKEQIVGVWKLVSVNYEDQETKALTPVLGEHPRGRQIATPDGRWLALVTAEKRPIPKTDEERAQALRTMISYSGRYRVEGNKVTTKVEIAWNEAWVGGEQVRIVRFEGDRLFIESPPMPHPNVGNKVVRIIVVWEREK
jgi:Lipocalin-like domain